MSTPEPPADFNCDLAIIGGGPAGLRAAEVAATVGRERGENWRVALFEGKPSVGRKFLVAGRGGLNLTHSEPLEKFVPRYGESSASVERWRELLEDFSPTDLQAWAADLGTETFVGTSGRVFPREKQAAGLLRRWVKRLRTLGVAFHVNHRWEHFEPLATTGAGWQLRFWHRRTSAEEAGAMAASGGSSDGETREVRARAVVFALGGASWPQTGSDGTWPEAFRTLPGVPVAPWQPANCGWEVEPPWPPKFLAAAEGLPLKNLVLTAGSRTVAGELLITRYGVEGGALYGLGATLRALLPAPVRLELDLKPQLSRETLAAKLAGAGSRVFSARSGRALLAAQPGGPRASGSRARCARAAARRLAGGGESVSAVFAGAATDRGSHFLGGRAPLGGAR